MCFSIESSFTAYIIGSIASLYLLINGDKYDKHIGLFSLIFVQMQLAEFFMWLDQNCTNINHYASIYAEYIIFLQPFSILLGALLFKTTNISNKILHLILLVYVIYILLLSKQIINNKKKLCSKSINNGHLEWEFVKKYSSADYYLYFIFMFLIWPFLNNKKGILVFIFSIISLLFGVTKNLKFDFTQWESKWCFYGVLLPGIIILYNLIYKK